MDKLHQAQIVISCTDSEFDRLRTAVETVLNDSFSESEWSIEVTSDQELLEHHRNTLVMDGVAIAEDDDS